MEIRRLLMAFALILAACCALAGCDSGAPDPATRAEVEQAVRAYLDALAASYSGFDVTPLRDFASPNEVETVKVMLKRLSVGGDRLQATLLGVEFEALEIFREINATVRLVEIWDVGRFDAFSGVEKGRNPSSIQNTVLQLRKVDGSWIVVGRTVLDRDAAGSTDPAATAAPAFSVAAPTPTPPEGT